VNRLHVAFAGIRSWGDYAEAVHGNAERGWPPQMCDIIGWSHTFRCIGTFTNYVGHVRTACMAMGLEVPDCNDPALKKAKTAIVKRMLWTSRHIVAYLFGLHHFVLYACVVPGQECSL